MSVPALRIRPAAPGLPNPSGDFVLYWMIASRRPSWNFALDRAIDWAEDLGKPLVVLEPLFCDYPRACDRFHRFVIEGMQQTRKALMGLPVTYYPFLEERPKASRGLLEALAAKACLVVTDDAPFFLFPDLLKAAPKRIPVLLECVDGNGILPMRAADRAFSSAYAFRRFLQKTLPDHLLARPSADPFAGHILPPLQGLSQEILERWPPAFPLLETPDLRQFPIDHAIPPAPLCGGAGPAEATLDRFLSLRLQGYAVARNHPDLDAGSGISPYLHFGHLSPHRVLQGVLAKEGWFFDRLSPRATGSRAGWWGLGGDAEAFLDQVITWRELGLNASLLLEGCDRFASLPTWAMETLMRHARDPRPVRYPLEVLASAETGDSLWNAAQRQLLLEGRIHNYLRMLWGKRILEWSPSPEGALATMLALNDTYALDGRDPNSISGIFWVLGRYDRPWGPERPIFGTVRFMSSRNAMKKLHLKAYLERYGPQGGAGTGASRHPPPEPPLFGA